MRTPILDARGMVCPQPLMMTKKALSELPKGHSFQLLIDHKTSAENVQRFVRENGSSVTTTTEKGVYTLTITKDTELDLSVDEKTYCYESEQIMGGHVICFKDTTMGSGPEELGIILMKGLIAAIKEATVKPRAVIFYTRAIFLVCKDSPVIGFLKELEKENVPIFVCGTCVDFFNKKNDIAVGTISNLYDILSILSQAHHVIYP
ncbi:MAG: sulfurtransferase-like selenium metabolism protein YedF [Chitinivibrionales bacterium]|nr:sulfurtransferase-like selenium metabolism protein YedF [Chitinivibrionales bacterium]